jgi:RNA polymerase sigma-70 factor, ECF subfamily
VSSESAKWSDPQPPARAEPLRAASPDLDFAALFTEYAPHVWRAVRSLGVRDADIEDVCQDVFLVVHRRLADFEGRSALRTWIYGIALRVVADYRKKAYRHRERLERDLPEAIMQAPQEQLAADRQAWERLDQLLDLLGEDSRRVFVLYELEGLSMPEVAGLLSCPLQTAYSRLASARATLQRGLQAWRGRRPA